MKRNWDVVRAILLALEENGPEVAIKSVPGVENGDYLYHVTILHEGGLIRGSTGFGPDLSKYASALRLTWEGHELLDKMRDDPTWKKIKTKASAQGVTLSVEAIGWFFKEVVLPHLPHV